MILNIFRDEYSRLFDFVSKKNLRIRNAKSVRSFRNRKLSHTHPDHQGAKTSAAVIDDFLGSDDEEGGKDHYKERLKREAAEINDDSESGACAYFTQSYAEHYMIFYSSEDEDFDPDAPSSDASGSRSRFFTWI